MKKFIIVSIALFVTTLAGFGQSATPAPAPTPIVLIPVTSQDIAAQNVVIVKQIINGSFQQNVFTARRLQAVVSNKEAFDKLPSELQKQVLAILNQITDSLNAVKPGTIVPIAEQTASVKKPK